MTCKQTTIPHTDPETVSQPCEDDPFGLDQIPAFLRRTPRDPGRPDKAATEPRDVLGY